MELFTIYDSDMLEKVGFRKIIGMIDHIKEADELRRQDEAKKMDSKMVFIENNLVSIQNVMPLVLAIQDLVKSLNIYQNRIKEADLTDLMMRHVVVSAYEEKEEEFKQLQFKYYNTQVASSFEKFCKSWKKHMPPILNLKLITVKEIKKKTPIFGEDFNAQRQAIMGLATPQALFKDFLFTGQNKILLAAVLSELLELNNNMMYGISDLVETEVEKVSGVDAKTEKRKRIPKQLVTLQSVTSKHLIEIDNSEMDELRQLSKSYMNETELKARLNDYLQKEILAKKDVNSLIYFDMEDKSFKIFGSRKEKIQDIVDKYFNKVDRRSIEATDKYLKALMNSSKTFEQKSDIEKIESQFYYLYSSGTKLPSETAGIPLSKLSPGFEDLAIEYPVLEGLKIDDVKDFLIFLGSIKYDLLHKSKESVIEEKYQMALVEGEDEHKNKLGELDRILEEMDPRAKESRLKSIAIEHLRLKSILASCSKEDRQVNILDAHEQTITDMYTCIYKKKKLRAFSHDNGIIDIVECIKIIEMCKSVLSYLMM